MGIGIVLAVAVAVDGTAASSAVSSGSAARGGVAGTISPHVRSARSRHSASSRHRRRMAAGMYEHPGMRLLRGCGVLV